MPEPQDNSWCLSLSQRLQAARAKLLPAFQGLSWSLQAPHGSLPSAVEGTAFILKYPTYGLINTTSCLSLMG